MFCCLFTVILVFIVLVAIKENLDEDGNIKMKPNNLRDMFTESIINDRYNKIYESVIQTASTGQTKRDFTIMCIRRDNIICDNYNGYAEWWRSRSSDEIILKNDTRYKQIKIRVLQKLQSSFPGNNITKVHKSCCVTYTISW